MIHKLIVCLLSVALVTPILGQTKVDTSGGTTKSQRIKQKKEHRMVAVIVTTLGTIEAELYEKDAPKTVANFAGLAKEGYYNGIIFHRVVPGFVIQGGDSTGTGRGGKSVYGGEFADELNPESTSYKEGYKKGVMAMANRGPNTNTSQFFILLADQAGMPKNYTIFGKVIKGIDVVEKIGKVELVPQGARDGKPKVPIVMNEVNVTTE
jgi:Peptidyl-prolyl cis-trans isomerase (rotamase) - cyclophilin family